MLDLVSAGFVRPDNGLSSHLEISGPQEKQNERALQCYPSESSQAAKIFRRACFSFLSPRRRSGERIEERGIPASCRKHASSPSILRPAATEDRRALSSMAWRRGSVWLRLRRAVHTLKEGANFSKQCFLSTGNQPRMFPASVSDGFPPGCFKEHLFGDS